jgi:hypothetical protein
MQSQYSRYDLKKSWRYQRGNKTFLNQSRTDNTMTKRKRTKGQTTFVSVRIKCTIYHNKWQLIYDFKNIWEYIACLMPGRTNCQSGSN